MWDILRAYCKIHPPAGSNKKKPSEVAAAILAKEISIAVDFTLPEVVGSNAPC